MKNSNFQPSRDFCELAGIIIGDGCISVNDRYKEIAIAGDLTEERDFYENHIVPLFNRCLGKPIVGKKFKGKGYPSVGCFGLYVFNKPIVDFLLSLGFKAGSKLNVTIPEVFLQTEEQKIAVLQGLFETDGSIVFAKNFTAKDRRNRVPKIMFSSTSKPLIEQMGALLFELGFHPMMEMRPRAGKRCKNPSYRLTIHRKADIKRWFEDIGFNSSKHTTKIKVWRKLGYCPPYTTIKERNMLLG